MRVCKYTNTDCQRVLQRQALCCVWRLTVAAALSGSQSLEFVAHRCRQTGLVLQTGLASLSTVSLCDLYPTTAQSRMLGSQFLASVQAVLSLYLP